MNSIITLKRGLNNFNKKIDILEDDYINHFSKWENFNLFPLSNSSKNIPQFINNNSITHIILSGGNNVSPKLYNSQKKVDDTFIERDLLELELLDIAMKLKIPVLGICKGMQLINTFFGGSLEKLKKNIHNPGKNHKIEISKNYQKNYSKKEFIVNSFHNYAVYKNTLGKNLNIVASNNNIVEILRHDSFPIVGVQWHPERNGNESEISELICKKFIHSKNKW